MHAPDREAQAPEPVLVSACLLGCACRYDGGHNRDLALEQVLQQRGMQAVPFCPEERGGLSTPRPPAWIEHGGASAVLDGKSRVITDAGADVSANFLLGAQGALELCAKHAIRQAFLKERSPSCGVRQTHVAGELVPGPGVTAQLLVRHGLSVHGVEGRRPQTARES